MESMNGVEQFHVKAINKIIKKMEKNNFIHVTTCEEGFEKCHELCKEYDLRIQEHFPDDCYYCMKDEEGNKEREGTFKYFQGKFSSLYEKMGQKFKGLLALKNEFVVEDNDMDDESLLSSTFPDFDPSKFDSESNIISETTDRRFKLATSSTKSDNKAEANER